MMYYDHHMDYKQILMNSDKDSDYESDHELIKY